MILNISGRTDIPAFYSDWLFERIQAGFVYVRNPYYPTELLQIDLDPRKIDLMVFCTKNPHPMLNRLFLLDPYEVYYFVSITPYDISIEPNVPPVKQLVKDVYALSKHFGKERVCVRYDPIIVNEKYTVEYHIHYFERLMRILENRIEECVISFVDLYKKTKRNMPEIQEVKESDRIRIAKAFSKIGNKYHIRIKTCAESSYEAYGIAPSGCISRELVERLLKANIKDISHKPNRPHCGCLPSLDIGAYHTCLHGCRYCYATSSFEAARQNYSKHDPHSPLLIGHVQTGDTIKKVKQETLIDPRLTLF